MADPHEKSIAVRIWANPDTNSGASQRGWLIYTQAGQYRGFVQEGHSGRRALAELVGVTSLLELPEYFIEVGNMQVTQAQYKRIIKQENVDMEFGDAGSLDGAGSSPLSSPFGHATR